MQADSVGGVVRGGVLGGTSGAAASPPSAESLVRLDLAVLGPAPENATAWELAVVFRIEPHWHIYWRNPGDSGMAPTLRVTLPEGWAAGEPRWPAPKAFVTPDERTFGYEKAVALFIPLKAPADFSGQATIGLECRWMVCRSICLVGSASRQVEVQAPGATSPSRGAGGGTSSGLSEELSAIIAQSRADLPTPAGTSEAELSVDRTGASGLLRIRLSGHDAGGGFDASADNLGNAAVQFFPEDTPGVEYGKPRLEKDDGHWQLHVPIAIDPGNSLGQPLRAAGVVVIPVASQPDPAAAQGGRGPSRRIIAVDLPIAGAAR